MLCCSTSVCDIVTADGGAARVVPRFLRWGHGGALESWVVSPRGWNRAYSGSGGITGRLGRAVAILLQGAFDVQSIRTSQTTDPWAKQTRPVWPCTKFG